MTDQQRRDLNREYQEILQREILKRKQPLKKKIPMEEKVVSPEELAKEEAFTEFQRIKKGGTLVKQPLSDCEKVKKEAIVLLKNPHKILMQFRKGYIGNLSREYMAMWRLNQISENIYYQLKRAYPQQVKDAKLNRAKVKKRVGIRLDDLVDLSKQMLTPAEKQQIYNQQQKLLEQYVERIQFTDTLTNFEEQLPRELLLTPEEVAVDSPEARLSACTQMNAILQLTIPDLLIQEHPDLLEGTTKGTRKASARNVFIGVQMKQGATMKEASDKWKTLTEDEKRQYKEGR